MRNQISGQRSVAQKTQEDADVMLSSITTKMAESRERVHEAQLLKERLRAEEDTIQQRKRAAEEELLAVQPQVEEAKRAVGGIKKQHLSELRAFRMPPKEVSDVLSGVMSLMGNFDESWNAMRRFLGKPMIKEEIINFDTRNIDLSVLPRVKQLLRSAERSFDPQRIAQVAMAAAPLAAWVKANVEYCDILEQIAPMEAELEEANNALEESRQELLSLEKQIREIEADIEGLRASFREKTSEVELLSSKLCSFTTSIEKAEAILGGLSSERNRWRQELQKIGNIQAALPFEMAILGGFCSAAGNMPVDVRRRVFEQLSKRAGNNICRLDSVELFVEESVRHEWISKSLPKESLCVQNAAMVCIELQHWVSLNTDSGDKEFWRGHSWLSQSCRFPVVIDSGRVMLPWLKWIMETRRYHCFFGFERANTEAKEGHRLEHVDTNDSHFAQKVSLAMRLGKSLIIEFGDKIPSAVYPLLRKQVIEVGPDRYAIQFAFATRPVELHRDFRCVFYSKSADKSGVTDSPGCTVIDFSPTDTSLEQQFLSAALAIERPELENEKTRLQQQKEEITVALVALENRLLQALSESKASMLEDDEFSTLLTETCAQAHETQRTFDKITVTDERISAERKEFEPFAKMATRIFLSLQRFEQLHNSYKFTFSQILRAVDTAISSLKKNDCNKKTRIRQMCRLFVLEVWKLVAPAVFAQHRTVFGLSLVQAVQPTLIPNAYWEFFLGRNLADTHSRSEARDLSFFPKMHQSKLHALLASFPELQDSVSVIAKKIDDIMDAQHPDNVIVEAVPDLSFAQKLLLMQAIRPDRVVALCQNFISAALKLNFEDASGMEYVTDTLRRQAETHMVLVTFNEGVDVSEDLESLRALLSQHIGSALRLQRVPMGKVSVEEISRVLQSSEPQRDIVVIENLHLGLTELHSLCALLLQIKRATQGPRYIFLTSEPHSELPASLFALATARLVVQNAASTHEILSQSLAQMQSQQTLREVSAQTAQAAFLSACLHARVMQRRAFVPLGFSTAYEFNDSNFKTALRVITHNSRNWSMAMGVIGEAVYGGRIDQPNDTAILKQIIRATLNPAVLRGSAPLVTNAPPLPASNSISEYTHFAEKLRDSEEQRHFGLPSNASVKLNESATDTLVATLNRIASPSARAGDDVSTQSTVLNALRQYWSRRRHLLKKVDQSLTSAARGNDCTTAHEDFILTELRTAARVLSAIDDVLSEGSEKCMSNDLEALVEGVIPLCWYNTWHYAEDTPPTVYLRDALSCAEAAVARSPKVDTSVVKFAEMFQPEAFLTAMLQDANPEDIMSMRFVAVWDAALARQVSNCVLCVRDAFVQGCEIQQGSLRQASASTPSRVPVGDVFLCAVTRKEAEKYLQQSGPVLSLPLYRTSKREGYVCDIECKLSDSKQRATFVLVNPAFTID
ncbi:MAG: hypothetical protein MHM6MM_003667 [Cercozoa sp. M6MM]